MGSVVKTGDMVVSALREANQNTRIMVAADDGELAGLSMLLMCAGRAALMICDQLRWLCMCSMQPWLGVCTYAGSVCLFIICINVQCHKCSLCYQLLAKCYYSGTSINGQESVHQPHLRLLQYKTNP